MPRFAQLFFGAIIALVVAAGSVVLVLPFFEDEIEPLVLKERWSLRWDALDVADQSLNLAGEGGWTAIAGINDAAIDAAFEAIEGAILKNTEDGILQGSEITIEEIEVSPGFGAMDAAVALTARRGGLTLGLVLEGAVLVNGIENGSREIEVAGQKRVVRTSEISLRIDPVRVAPSLAPAELDRDQSGFWTDLAPGLANVVLPADLLTVRFPLQAEFHQELGLDEERTTVLDETTNASVTYHLSMPKDEILVGVAYGAPVYTGSAVWVMAREVAEAPPEIRPRQRPEGNLEEIEAAARALDEDIKRRLGSVQRTLEGVGTPRVALAVDNRLLTSIQTEIMSLPEDRRRLTVRLRDRSGKLSETRWRDDILGEGGAYVEIGCPDCGSLDAQLHDLSFDTSGEVWRAVVNLSARAEGNLHAHFDPLIGGGAGTSIGVEGTTGGVQPIGAELRSRIRSSDGGHRAAFLAVQPSCDRLELIATTDGRMKFDVGWMSMPRVGARLFVPIGAEAVEPVLVMASEPLYLYWQEPTQVSGSEESGGWWLTMPKLASVLTLSPSEFALQDGQMHAAIDVAVRHVPSSSDAEARAAARAALEVEEAEAISAAREATAKLLDEAREESRCKDANVGMRVLLGDVEFGPNNEIVKFFRNAWNDITNGPGPNNEIVKFLDGAGETFHQAEAIGRGLVEGLLDEGGKVLTYGAEATAAHLDAARRAAEALAPDVTIKDNGGVKIETPLGGIETHGNHGGLGVSIGGMKF